jgi:hypothetical protein
VWIGLPRENVMPGKLEAMVLESSTTDDRYRPTRRDVVTALAATALSMSPIPVLGLIHEQREGHIHMAQTVETLLRENIHGVFSEPDTEKRHKAIARLWAEDGVFIDHNARYEGIQVLPLRPMGLPKSSPTSSLPSGAKLWHCTASAS